MNNVLVVEHKEKGMTGVFRKIIINHVSCEGKHAKKYYKEAQINNGTKWKRTSERNSGDIVVKKKN